MTSCQRRRWLIGSDVGLRWHRNRSDHSRLLKTLQGGDLLNIVVSVSPCHFHRTRSPTQTKQAATRPATPVWRGWALAELQGCGATQQNSTEQMIVDNSSNLITFNVSLFKLDENATKAAKNILKVLFFFCVRLQHEGAWLFCLHLVSLTKTHCMWHRGQTNVECISFLIKQISSSVPLLARDTNRPQWGPIRQNITP